jgi:uncharacterized protein YbjT (DUF2867 family)
MKLNPVIFGTTGMVGKAALLECLEDGRVEKVLVVNRNPLEMTHPKIQEIIHTDFKDFSILIETLESYNACLFCMGTTALGKKEEEYAEITYDITFAAAKAMEEANPDASFCYVSGIGTDSTEQGKTMWARVKGKTENDLMKMKFPGAYMFRPGYIQPLKGIQSKTKWYNDMYKVMKPFYFLLKPFKKYVTDTTTIGKAMIEACLGEPDKRVIESKEINKLGRKS